MAGPALASSFRQQATNDGAGASGASRGYGSYGYMNGSSSNSNDEYSNSRGAYRRPSEDGSMQQQQQPRGYGGYNQNMMDGSMQQSSSSSSSGMPYSSQAATANPTRLAGQQNQQNYQHQQLQRHGQQDDMASSFGGSTYAGNSSSKYGGNSSTVNGGSSPTSTGPTPGGSSAQQPSKPVTGSPEEIENSRRIARTHFEEFKAFLDAEGQRDPNARANAREKLTRLTRPQFQELSTDVYDELMRRQRAEGSALSGSAPEFLPQKPDFHPKRNQARQKLSTLPKTRFRDLASDVYFELERRYPEFKEDELPPSPTGTSGPEDPGRNQYNDQPNSSSTRAGTNGTYAAPSSSNVPQAMSRSGSRDDSQNGPRLQSSTSQKRPQFPQGKPSQMDYNQQSSSSSAAAPSAAANEVIIPNKSKVIEEDISLPASAPTNVSQQQRGYGNYANQNGYMGRKSSDRERPGASGNASQESLERDSPSPSNNTLGGANDQQQPPRKSNDTPRMGNNGPLLPTSPDWNNSLARASEASSLGTRLIGGYGSTPSEGGMREWESDEIEKVKSDYEYKIATMQNRMAGLEKDLRDAMDAKEKDESDSRDRIHQLENEVEKLKMRLEDAQSSIEQLEQDLAEAQEQAKSLPAYDEASSREKDEQHQAELSDLRTELDSFRSKHSMQQDATENLKNEIEGLVDTLKEMNMRQDDLVNERDADLEKIHKLEEEVKEWRNRYETAKTELRDLKATSQLFVKPTKADDDYMPTSPHGAIMDSHVTRFQSSIDDLLISGRSDAPSSVIIATKQVINAVARIDEDVQEYENAGLADSLSPDDRERLHALKSKCNATLSNLTTAARNHATGHGLSPVSLLDAAASHLSNTIIELVRLLLLRKAGTPLAGTPRVMDDLHSSSMKPSASSTSISSRLDNASQVSSSSNMQQQQSSSSSRGFPSRLASLKREEEGNTYGNSQNPAPGSSGRTSPASFRSRTVTASDRTQSTSPEPTTRNDNAGMSSTSKMTASASQSSLASNFQSDSRRGAYSQQQQQHQAHPDQYQQDAQMSNQHRANESQTSNQSYHNEHDDGRRVLSEEHSDRNQYLDEGAAGRQDPSEDPEAWADLKNYLESQTEAIVHSITALLAAIRGGAQPMKLQENLSQIITIVSSIVQILQDNLPTNLHEEAKPTIQELSSNCDKLTELQNSAEGAGQTFSKQTKQAMATASFGVAKSLKSINSLLATV